jgi:integrase
VLASPLPAPSGDNMPTRRVELNKDHLAEAREAAAARAYSTRDPLIFAHVNEKGLQLRVQDGTASWILKFNGSSKSLGKLSEVGLKAAVERAQRVRAIMKNGDDPKQYLLSVGAKKSHDEAAADAASKKARADGMWTWRELAAAYRDQYLGRPKKKRSGDIKPPSQRTVQDFDRYTSTAAHREFLDDVLVRDITAVHIERVRNAVQKSNGMNGGRKAVQWISAAMTWGRGEHQLHTGLGMTFPWWTAVSTGHVPGVRRRYLTLEQIARVLYLAEKYRQMPSRGQTKPTTDAALAALWWIVLSAQRTSASMTLLSSRVVPDKENPGWMIAAFPAESMKSKRYHALPIPPRMTLLFERAKIGLKRETEWAFPSAKIRKRGSDEIVDMHVHDSIVGQLIRRLRGKDDVARKRPQQDAKRVQKGKESLGPITDLLEGIPEFSPHDLRRSLATILSDRKVRGDAASAILDHSSATPGEQEFHQADITRLAYNQSQRLALKREAMEVWTNAVFDAVEKEWEANQPRRSSIAKPVKPLSAEAMAKHKEDRARGQFTPDAPWYVHFESSNMGKRGSLDLASLNRRQSFEEDELEQ